MSNSYIDYLQRKKNELISRKERIEELKSKSMLKNSNDIYGDGNPTFLFPILLKLFGHLLDPNDMSCFSKNQIQGRKLFNTLVRKVGPMILKTKQVIEDRNELAQDYFEVEPLNIPDEPVIFVSNHGFRDDILGSLIAADRHAYLMFGSLPQFYNAIEGPLIYGNGVVLVNRSVKESKKASLDKCKKVIENGCSILMYPEGVWNKSPNKLTLPLWKGVYELAKQTGAKIVPIVHYIKDPTLTTPKDDNSFHTVVDNAIDISNMTEEEALELITEKFSTWNYLMMEKYGKSTREELLNGFYNSQKAWDEQLRLRLLTADKYDSIIETCADYRPRGIVLPEDVFGNIANLEITKDNLFEVIGAKKIVKTAKENDFQRKY